MTSAYVQTAWLVTLGGEQQSISFAALLIRNQGVIDMFEQNRYERRNIVTVTSFGVVQQNLFFFRMLMHVLVYLFPASCNFFLDFSVAKLLTYIELLSRIET